MARSLAILVWTKLSPLLVVLTVASAATLYKPLPTNVAVANIPIAESSTLTLESQTTEEDTVKAFATVEPGNENKTTIYAPIEQRTETNKAETETKPEAETSTKVTAANHPTAESYTVTLEPQTTEEHHVIGFATVEPGNENITTMYAPIKQKTEKNEPETKTKPEAEMPAKATVANHPTVESSALTLEPQTTEGDTVKAFATVEPGPENIITSIYGSIDQKTEDNRNESETEMKTEKLNGCPMSGLIDARACKIAIAVNSVIVLFALVIVAIVALRK